MSTEVKSADTATPLFDCRQAFVETMIELATADKRIVAVCNDSIGSSNLGAFVKQFPDRLVNVGIAEQNMVGVAAGLANGGFIPFICGAGPFLSGRATEQIKADLAYSNFPAVLCAMSPGMSYGELGPTHHSIEDLPWMRAIDNLNVLVPADPQETRTAMHWAAFAENPTYMRIARFKTPAVSSSDYAFAPGKAQCLREGTDVTLIAIGTLVSRALEAATTLAGHGISARVLNMASVKPIDRTAVLAAAAETGAIVTAEEGVLTGGLGAAVAEIVVQNDPVPMKMLGVTSFAPTGSAAYLLEHFGLTASGLVAAAKDTVARKRSTRGA